MERLNGRLAGGLALLALLLGYQAQAASIEEKAATCNACHGEKGVPIDKQIPIIWGQMEGYLYLQLKDIKAGVRVNEQMTALMTDLTRDDLAALASYYAAKPWPDLGQPRAPKPVAEKAMAANLSIGCTGCHLDAYQGYSTVPRLAGQSAAYLAKATSDFRTRTRANNPGMTDLMNATALDDLDALTAFLAGL